MEAVQEYITCRINEYVYTSFLLLYSLLLFKSDSIVMVKILLFCVNLAQDGFSLFGLFTGLCHSHMVYGYRINGFASGHVPLLGNARAALTIRNPRKVVQFQTLKGFDKSHYMGTMATQSASDEKHKLLADVTSKQLQYAIHSRKESFPDTQNISRLPAVSSIADRTARFFTVPES